MGNSLTRSVNPHPGLITTPPMDDITELSGLVKKAEFDVDLRPYSTIGIGGRAKAVVTPSNEEEVAKVVSFCNKRGIPYYVRGAGSNTIFGDLEVLIDVSPLNKIEYSTEDGIIIAGSGARLGRIGCKRPRGISSPEALAQYYMETGSLAGKAHKLSLSGLEYIADIPGSVGGAVVMNAGSLTNVIGNIVESVICVTGSGRIREIQHDKLGFDYRTSIFLSEDYEKYVITSIRLKLQQRAKKEIRDAMFDSYQFRKKNHPDEPSIGSVWIARGGYQLKGGVPEIRGHEAIKSAGLCNYRVGGLRVSEVYPMFFVNDGNAKLSDFLKLMKVVYVEVYKWSGGQIRLKPEVRILPETLMPDFNNGYK